MSGITGIAVDLSQAEPLQDPSQIQRRPAPLDVYKTVLHSSDPTNAAAHGFTVNLVPGNYDLRIHFSSPTQLLLSQGQRATFDLKLEGKLVLDNYDPAVDLIQGGPIVFNKVVIKEFWNVAVDQNGLQVESIPKPLTNGSGDSFELAIEIGHTTHAETFVQKVGVK